MAAGMIWRAAAAVVIGLGWPAAALAVTQSATVSANVVKPLTLMSVQDLDLGTIALQPGSWSAVTVGISRAGTFNCASTNLVCNGVTQVAKYKVTGSNRQVVSITAPNVTMVSAADPSKTLTLVVDSPASVTLTTSGEPGVIFSVGGSISVSSATASGSYSGTFSVTVDYQ